MSSRLTKMREQLTRFGVGSSCIHKRGNIPALITKTLGEKKWLVELLDNETGETTSTKEVTSQQLRRPKAEDNHPLLRAESDELCQQEESNNNNSSTHQVRLQDSIEGIELSLAQESQQELENHQDREPIIHQSAHRPLSRMARAAAALLASPFNRRSSSKSSGGSPSVSSTSSFQDNRVPCRSSDDESNGDGRSTAASDIDQEEDLGDDNDLDQEEDLIDGDDQPNGHNENPAPSDLDPDLEMEEELGNSIEERMRVSLKAPTSLPWGKQWSRMMTNTKRSGIVTW